MNEIEYQRLYKIAAVAKSFYDFGSSTFEKLRKWVSVGILKLRAVYPRKIAAVGKLEIIVLEIITWLQSWVISSAVATLIYI